MTIEYTTATVYLDNKTSSDATHLQDGVYKFTITVSDKTYDITMNCVGITTYWALVYLIDYHVRMYGITARLIDSTIVFSGRKPGVSAIIIAELLVGPVDWLWAGVSGYVPGGFK
jgi:hypothetical protein